MPSNKADLQALRRMIAEAETILSTTSLPEGRAKRAGELLGASVKLADELLRVSPASALGARGGKKTAERGGPEYYRKIANMRKTHGGGRPRKERGND